MVLCVRGTVIVECVHVEAFRMCGCRREWLSLQAAARLQAKCGARAACNTVVRATRRNRKTRQPSAATRPRPSCPKRMPVDLHSLALKGGSFVCQDDACCVRTRRASRRVGGRNKKKQAGCCRSSFRSARASVTTSGPSSSSSSSKTFTRRRRRRPSSRASSCRATRRRRRPARRRR